MEASYPPDNSVPRYAVSLDEAQGDRWTSLALQLADEMAAMIDEFLNHLEIGPLTTPVEEFLATIDENADMILGKMEYGEEIRGIAQAANIDLAKMIVFNLGYELMGVCTSIVAQDSTGHMFHGRNLDFGLFLGHNSTGGPNANFQWVNTELLRPLVMIVDFTRDGATVDSQVVFMGYVGLLTGVRKGAVSVSVDSRFDDNLDRFLMSWLRDPSDSATLLSHRLRSLAEDDGVAAAGFDAFVAAMGATALVGPAYAIVGGAAAGQGVVLTLGPNMTAPVDAWPLAEALPANAAAGDKFYVLETNYDHWEKAPLFDDRRTPAEDCMDHHVTAEGVTKEALYDVLHASPNRNRLTTYTALMDCAEGTVEASLQYCWENSCTLW